MTAEEYRGEPNRENGVRPQLCAPYFRTFRPPLTRRAGEKLNKLLERIRSSELNDLALRASLGPELTKRLKKLNVMLWPGIADHGSRADVVPDLPVSVLLFKTVNPKLNDRDLIRISTIFSEVSNNRSRSTPIRMSRRPPTSPEESTGEGYELALDLREWLGLPDDQPLVGEFDLESYVLPKLGMWVETSMFDDSSTEGLSIWIPGNVPTIVLNLEFLGQ